MANASSANGILELRGDWSEEDIDLFRPVLASWRFYDAYYLNADPAALSPDCLKISFEGMGRWEFSSTLEQFHEWTAEWIEHPKEDTDHPLTREAYLSFLKAMSGKELEIWLDYWDSGEGFAVHETGFFIAEDLSEEGTEEEALSLEEDLLLTYTQDSSEGFVDNSEEDGFTTLENQNGQRSNSMNETPYTSIAYGTLELKGEWTRGAVDLFLPVLEGSGYYWGYLSLVGSVSPENPKAIFGGGGDMPLGQFLCEELYEMLEDDIRNAAPASFPVRDGMIAALADVMLQNHLEIEMRFTVKNIGEAEYHEVYTVYAEMVEMMEGVCLCVRDVFSDRPPFRPSGASEALPF